MSRRLRLPAQCGGDASVASDATATRNYATVTEDAAPTGSAARRADDGLTVKLTVVCNGFLLCTIYYFANIIIDDVRDDGSVVDIDWSFVHPSTVAEFTALWFVCHVALWVGSLGFRCWRYGRSSVRKYSVAGCVCWDWAWSAAAVVLHVAMMVVPLRISWQMDHHVVATCAVVVEQVRLLMKSIDYLHEHVRSALVAKATNDSAAHYLFFANVPTFMYRDSYRRTPRVRLLPALGYACIFMTCFITVVAIMLRSGLRPFCLGADVPLLKATGLRGSSLFLASYWITTVRMAPACLVLFVGTPMVLCSWNLMVTELTRFPADGIIQAWWNASSHDKFLRHWNPVAKGFLSKYVYQPMLRRRYSVTTSKLVTVFVAAVGHEYILVVTSGFVIPYLTVLYVFGTALLLHFGVKKDVRGNFAMLLINSFGVAMVSTFYMTEYVARRSCPATTGHVWDIFVPRSFSCDRFQFNYTCY